MTKDGWQMTNIFAIGQFFTCSIGIAVRRTMFEPPPSDGPKRPLGTGKRVWFVSAVFWPDCSKQRLDFSLAGAFFDEKK
jgi:hypothetical protein